MKKSTWSFMLKPSAILVALACAFTALANDQAKDKDKDKDQYGAKQKQGREQAQSNSKDAAFIKEAIRSNMKEIHMAKMAASKAQNLEVKQLAQRIVTDHTKVNQELRQLAQKQGISVPAEGDQSWRSTEDSERKHGAAYKPPTDQEKSAQGAPGQAERGERGERVDRPGHKEHEHADLEGKSGAEFDKAFAEHMLKHHKKDISKFQKAAQECQDPELRALIQRTLPTLREHFRLAKNAARSVGVDEATISAADREESEASGAPGRSQTERDAQQKPDQGIQKDRDTQPQDDLQPRPQT